MSLVCRSVLVTVLSNGIAPAMKIRWTNDVGLAHEWMECVQFVLQLLLDQIHHLPCAARWRDSCQRFALIPVPLHASFRLPVAIDQQYPVFGVHS
ncbi:hypothetical protein IWX50DRAFT_642198 [Phyllosticta citricarpa]